MVRHDAADDGVSLIDVSTVRTDGGTQPRAHIDPLIVDDYAEAMRRGDKFPPLDVFFDGATYWLADGFHRHAAAKQASISFYPCNVHQGVLRDAVLFSVSANSVHGLRRTNADKRRAVETLLRDSEWAAWSDREIAVRTHTSAPFVAKIKADPTVNVYRSDDRKFERNGKQFQMATGNIGRREQPTPAPVPTPAPRQQPIVFERPAPPAPPSTRLTPEARQAVINSPLRDDPSEIKRLSQVPRAQQAAVAERVADGTAPNVKVAAIYERQDREREREAERPDAVAAVEQLAAVGTPAFPSKKKYSVVLADPPWHYNDRRNKHTRFCGGAAAHYPTMKTDEICALPVRDIVTADAFLFLWATWPTLDDAMRVIEAWGFEYVTCAFNWIKTNPVNGEPFFGIGYYTKSNSEVCLLASRGEPWTVSNHVAQVVIEPIREHSRKPEAVRGRIVRLLGDVPRIELFAREPADGWDAWGNQACEAEKEVASL